MEGYGRDSSRYRGTRRRKKNEKMNGAGKTTCRRATDKLDVADQKKKKISRASASNRQHPVVDDENLTPYRFCVHYHAHQHQLFHYSCASKHLESKLSGRLLISSFGASATEIHASHITLVSHFRLTNQEQCQKGGFLRSGHDYCALSSYYCSKSFPSQIWSIAFTSKGSTKG